MVTLTAELETRIKTFEKTNFRKLLGVTYKDRITTDEIRYRNRKISVTHIY